MTLQARSNAQHSSGQYTWNAISNMIEKITGQTFDYETFQAKYDATPALQHIVADFNDHGITLNVKHAKHDDMVSPEITPEKQQADINKSAQHAANNTLNRI
jgi:hypothetical protein